jgi:UDP-2,3-diacylglucosamine pyrophosphatase LpxH
MSRSNSLRLTRNTKAPTPVNDSVAGPLAQPLNHLSGTGFGHDGRFDAPAQPQYYRSLFVSDLHMGAPRFDAAAFLDFLNNTESEFLYLVGDIIDGWKLTKAWFWPDIYDRIFQQLLRKQSEGTKVIFVHGNHDEALRGLAPAARFRFLREFGVPMTDELIHHLADGRRCLILHGDQFDRAIIRGPVARLSDRIYDWLVHKLNLSRGAYIEVDGRWKRFSLSKSLRRSGQWALYLINNFEAAARRRARHTFSQVLICGHTHIPRMKDLRGITYGNCGSWVSGRHTYIAEQPSGALELLVWPSALTPPTEPLPGILPGPLPPVRLHADTRPFSVKARRIHDLSQRIWAGALLPKLPLPEPDEGNDILTSLLHPQSLEFGAVDLAQIPISAENEDVKVIDQIGWDGMQIEFRPPFGIRILPKPSAPEQPPHGGKSGN